MSSTFPTTDEESTPRHHTPTFHLKQGDTGPPLKVRFADDEGNPVELDSNTDAVAFHMEDEHGTALTTVNSASIESGPEGVVAYEWGADDTDETGTFFAEFRVTFNEGESDERIETFPNSGYITIEVIEEIE
jgi:hypothetical protein